MPNATLLARALQNASLSAVEDRLVQTILTHPGVIGTKAGSFEVKEDTGSNLKIKVGSGAAFDRAVVAGSVPGQGTYIVEHQDATTTLDLDASDPSNPRIDLVILRVYDDEWDSSGEDYADIEVITGTPDSVPDAPALPDNAIALASIEVAASATGITDGDITDLREESPVRGQLVKTLVVESSTDFSKDDYPWLREVRAKVQAAGGAGGGATATDPGNCAGGGGGGGGGYAEGTIPVEDLDASVAITIGAGGVGDTGATPVNGGNSSFGAYVVANGGSGGNRGGPSTPVFTGPNGGVGGSGGGSHTDLIIRGGPGYGAVIFSTSNSTGGRPGQGGDAHLGGGGHSSRNTGDGSNALGYGGGGSGGINLGENSAKAGGNGGPGVVILDLYA